MELAVYLHAISIRNQSIPLALPGTWEQLGRFEHAEALALNRRCVWVPVILS